MVLLQAYFRNSNVLNVLNVLKWHLWDPKIRRKLHLGTNNAEMGFRDSQEAICLRGRFSGSVKLSNTCRQSQNQFL